MKIVPMKVELLRTSGSDLDIVNAARVSFHKESEWEVVGQHEEVYLESRSVEYTDIL